MYEWGFEGKKLYLLKVLNEETSVEFYIKSYSVVLYCMKQDKIKVRSL